MIKVDSCTSIPNETAERLLIAARRCADNAHAPYSGFPVGAAALDENGTIHSGANVENASYGLTICAERVAIFTAIASGARSIKAVAVVSPKSQPISPCGACRQVIAEFAESSAPVFGEGVDGLVSWTVGDLLPYAFSKDNLSNI